MHHNKTYHKNYNRYCFHYDIPIMGKSLEYLPISMIFTSFKLLFNMSINGKINRQADVIAFIHKRAKVAERREDNLMDAAANQRRQGNNKKVEKK